MSLMDRENMRKKAIERNQANEKDFRVVRVWKVKARNAEDAIQKTKDKLHEEVKAHLILQVSKGPGGYIPF